MVFKLFLPYKGGGVGGYSKVKRLLNRNGSRDGINVFEKIDSSRSILEPLLFFFF